MSWWSKSATPIPTTPDGYAEAMAALHETRRMQFAMLIYITFVGFITLMLYKGQLSEGQKGIIVGGLMANVGIVIGFYYTTSMGASAAALRSKVPTVTTTTTPTAPTPDNPAPAPTTVTSVGAPAPAEPPVTAAPVEPPKDRP